MQVQLGLTFISSKALSMKKLNFPDPVPSSMMYNGSVRSNVIPPPPLTQSRKKPLKTCAYERPMKALHVMKCGTMPCG